MSNSPEMPKDNMNTNTSYQSNDQKEIKDKNSATTPDIPSFGWSQYAERVNGRFAMIGFISILLIEISSHSIFINWAGFTH